MNFQFASDLHLEFARNKKALLKKTFVPQAEILILAGDIMLLSAINDQQDFLNYISDHFKMTYWLPGNHEYFDSDLAKWPTEFEEAIRSNLVISHPLPSFLNFPKKHQNDPIKVGFATNLDDFILKMAPNAWIYGHHHSNIPPFLIGKPQFYTNQLGYVKYKADPGFNRSAIMSI